MLHQIARLLVALLMVCLSWGWLAPASLAAPTSVTQAEVVAPAESGLADFVQGLSDIADKAFEATNTGDFATAETYWTQLIDRFPQNPAIWSNRGNSRVSQNKLELAISDYNRPLAN